tara:strand:+ start:217 stop:462 length:246 start_codon:yes stop_codon:yes gene_type:complete
MKFLFQLTFFIVAVLLTFVSLIVIGILVVDSTPQGLFQLTGVSNYTDEDWAITLGALIIPSTIAVVIYFLLWKTNFFSRNK